MKAYPELFANRKNVFLLVLFAVSLFMGCEKEEPSNPLPQPANFKALQEEALAERTQTAQFEAEEGLSFTSAKGTMLQIPPNSLFQNGDTASGTVALEFVELYERKDMLVTNSATMGIAPDGSRAALVSGGEFYVNVTKDGEALDINNQMQMFVPANLTGGGDPAMTLWQGVVDADGTMAWEEEKDDTGQGEDRVVVEGEGDNATYYVSFGEFGWTNVDRFYSDPRPKTTLKVEVPDGYDAGNASVYLSYDGEPNTLARLDTYDSGTGLFSEHYGQIPVGLEMHVIFVTEEAGQWRYAIKGVTVAADDIYSFTLSETLTGTEQDLVDAIDALP